MVTISSIIEDIDSGIMANNMIETCFSYRIVYYINEGNSGTIFRADTPYENMRKQLEDIIRGNLALTNTIVISAVTARKNGETVSLLSRPYTFSMDGYFRKLCGEKEKKHVSGCYGRRRAGWR